MTVRARVLIAKLGLDGHDVGAKAIVHFLRDAGFEVIYLGVRQVPARVAAVALDEDVDLVGISMLSGAHLQLVPMVIEQLRAAGEDIPVVVGGTIPPQDVAPLEAAGVRAVFTAGVRLEAIARAIAELTAQRRAATSA